MMTTSVLYAGDGVTRDFAVPFPYLSPSHVRVRINGIPLVAEAEYVFTSAGMLRLVRAPATNAAIEVARETPIDGPLVQFQNGAVLNERDLNLAVLQTLYLLQETRDALDKTVGDGVRKVAGGAGIVGSSVEEILANVTASVLNSALLADLQSRISDIDFNAEAILQATSGLASEVNRVDGLFPRLDGVDTAILAESQQRVDGDVALSSRVDGLAATSAGHTAQIAAEQTTRADAVAALAQTITTLQALSARIFIQAEAPSIDVAPDNAGAGDIWYDTDDGNHPYRLAGSPLTWQSIRDGQFAVLQAQVQNEQSARIGADSALSSNITSLAASMHTQDDTLAAAVVSEASARADADTALGTRIDTVVASAADNAAAIQSEATARAFADTALASSVQTVQTSVNGNTAAIQQQATSIAGLSAQYTVKVDVNGYVTGFGLATTAKDGAPTSEFIVLADRFSIVTPGKTKVVPFSVDANGVYMNTAFIRTLVVDKIAGGAVNSQWGFYNGGGRIVLDTGAYMKVIGVGFGANNDLLEWFGPKMEIWQCTKANATTYVGTNGDAYFGGTLRAGTIFNSRQSTDTGFPVSLPLGPFGSNGGSIAVVLSYGFTHGEQVAGAGIGSAPLSATIDLYRSVNGGPETLVATLAVTGTETWESENGTRYYSGRMSGSLTWTDNGNVAQPRTFRAALRARSLYRTSGALYQNITLTSTEQ